MNITLIWLPKKTTNKIKPKINVIIGCESKVLDQISNNKSPKVAAKSVKNPPWKPSYHLSLWQKIIICKIVNPENKRRNVINNPWYSFVLLLNVL